MRKSRVTKSIKETQKLGEELAKRVQNGGVICLYGDLGAGKTTLVQGIARGLGIKQKVVSPTFIIVRKYGQLWHVDLYRLRNLLEIKDLGLEELWQDKRNIVVVEWPERAVGLWPKNAIKITLETVGESERKISI